MNARIKNIFANANGSADAFIVTNGQYPNVDLNFFYASGIKSGTFEGCYVVGKNNGKGYLLTSELEETIARKETDLEILVFKSKEDRESQLKELLSNVNNLGINSSSLPFKQYSDISKLTKAKLTDVSEAFSKTRSIKDNEEIKDLSKACEISARAGEELVNHIKSNITERELSRKLVELQFSNDATNLAFPPIVAFGENSAAPHHLPTDRKLGRNEFILIDFGAEFNRYASDTTRTFVFGKADKRMKEIYDTVLDAQLGAINMVKEGSNGKYIDKFARAKIDKKFKGRFIHSLGHEVGLSVHDGNRLGSQVDFILKKNMVVTVEPGVYIPSVGGVRIEDTVLVTKNKPKILTDSIKELIQI
ncbi:MAG: aminopeptidase P family protein [Candidatus Aenigmarchaeota archaeon]|nr:aminopeptidase P family protein [Candidatus Aenigmarchaeota archaeon]